ncbi:hypothetical protein, partial [Streptococcus pseudopneumoniae]|uniref:hypothetical protein n=1 Tax=Streptococcus pseudopneumoniae TaxID=257758 RepID=UPI0019D59C42
ALLLRAVQVRKSLPLESLPWGIAVLDREIRVSICKRLEFVRDERARSGRRVAAATTITIDNTPSLTPGAGRAKGLTHCI